jgi:rRNA maturation endonuclease Nob1
MIAALVVGTLLAVLGLCYVLYPLFYGVSAPSGGAARAKRVEQRDAKAARAEAVAVLREIEFDRETGKLSDTDYAELKADYTRRALDAMREEDRAGAAAAPAAAVDTATDPVEAAIRRARAHVLECAHCGPRPEPDATYCSDCGRFLPGRCADCGAPVDAPGARFCNSCGRTLAAA